jgi:tetratricopeptide (TPR) repeat protein
MERDFAPMFNLVISLLLSLVVSFVLNQVVGLDAWIAVAASLAVFALCYFLISRLVMKKIGALMEAAQRDVQANRADKAIKSLKDGFKYSNWQFYVKTQINSQIGTILFLKRDFAAAFPYLEKSFVRNWVAMGMLGVCYLKKNKLGKMSETFEKATAASKKESLLWALYAYCLDKSGERAKAIEILEKARKKGCNDEGITGNLALLQAGKKMKMKVYGDLWFQFHLEKPGSMIKQQTKAMTGRRKMVRR